jgi:hypothetical protein
MREQRVLAFIAGCLGALLMGAASFAVEAPSSPQVRLPFMSQAPKLDGVVQEQEWAGAVRMEQLGSGPMLDAQACSFWVGSDGNDLFIAMVSQTPPGDALLAKVPPSPDDGDARTWLDDSIELVIDPLRSDATGRRRLYHANLNARGAVHDMAYIPLGAAQPWRGRWRTASKVKDDRWHFELAIPLADMGVTAADLDKPMGVRVARNWVTIANRPRQSQWSAQGGAYLNPDTMPLVTWDASAPVVQVQGLVDSSAAAVNLRVHIANTTRQAIELNADLKVVPKNSQPAQVTRSLTLAPGKSQVVELQSTPTSATEPLATTLSVKGKDGRIFYARDFTWTLERPADLWQKDEQSQKKIDLSFAYYPTFDTARAQVNYAALAQRQKVRAVTLQIVPAAGGEPLCTITAPGNSEGQVKQQWTLSALPAGDYRCVATLEGADLEPVSVAFIRRAFPWEGNSLGKSDLVPHGFEPVQVEPGAVTTVLRRHELDGLGLWKQVTSMDQPLLAAPMRLEITAAGQTTAASGSDLKLTRVGPTRSVSESRWAAGPIQGEASATWDVDGAMFWTLTLPATATPIERMTLVVPVHERMARLMHACTDGIRFNFAGRIAPGEGRVWDSTKAPRNSIIGSYVPYLWVGAEERGICVFGENDRGWVTSREVPCQELVRRGDTLEIRLHLIASATTIREPRQITIGFQATPTKPMPADWRTWNTGWSYRNDRVTTDILFLGSCWYWGALTPCLDVYPVNEDYSLWDQFAATRKSGQADQAFIENWLTRYPASSTPQLQTTYRNHIQSAFHNLKSKPQRVAVYTNARGVRFDTPEGQTFLDEWHREPFSTRKWELGGGVAYDLNPGPSFRDYALWHYRRMLDTFVDDIYWDDIFLQSNFDLPGTHAYTLSDGQVQPAMGLLDMRELIRRTLVLGEEQGRPMKNWAHMTNTAIAPILSFSQIAFTWEDHAGDRPFQERYSLDYVRAESLGRQHGNVPFALLLVKGDDKAKTAWAARTFAGVMLTHEIKTHSPLPDLERGLKALWSFGYGRDGATVHNDWDPSYPLAVTGATTSSIVVAKPGQAMIVVCDWSGGGQITLAPDPSLNLGAGFSVTDVESGQPIQTAGDGRVTFTLPRHDFRIFHLVAADPQRKHMP